QNQHKESGAAARPMKKIASDTLFAPPPVSGHHRFFCPPLSHRHSMRRPHDCFLSFRLPPLAIKRKESGGADRLLKLIGADVDIAQFAEQYRLFCTQSLSKPTVPAPNQAFLSSKQGTTLKTIVLKTAVLVSAMQQLRADSKTPIL
ncbi:MAG: hypothetical protein QM296_10750, partial [Bacillota bacterium]|nr:hypothetical protein [Bacillota bacterium]